MTPAAQLRPLPVRPRPRPGETTGTYLEYLARANHLPVRYLHRCLSAPAAQDGQESLARLAIISGRTVTALRHALADLSCGHCGAALNFHARGRRARWCSHACALRAFRQRQRGEPEHRSPARTPAANCGHCGKPITRKHRGRPARWCSHACSLRALRQRQRGEPEHRDLASPPAADNCGHCGKPITRKHRGRPARWCSGRCASRAHRQRTKQSQGRTD